MTGLALIVLLATAAGGPDPLLVDRLKADILKTDRAIGVTEQQIARSPAKEWAPELQFRLADLYVEKSRYLYLLQREQLGQREGSVVAPETRLVKQKAIELYERILRDDPDWSGCDRVRFYLAHEYRELGQFEKMLSNEEDLFRRHPKSPLAAEAMLIVGDHWFSAKDLAKAEEAYQKVLSLPPSATQDIARFKMGWVRLNQSRHADAVVFFEAAAASPLLDGAPPEVVAVKREALLDLVFSYTEARPTKGAVEYFEKLAGGHALFLTVLEKLANRYFIKQEFEASVAAYRRLLELSRNPARDAEFAGRLYESLKAGKVAPRATDVRELVRIAARIRTGERLTLEERKATVSELEVYARDLATKILLAARAQGSAQKQEFSEAADAHGAWLELFRESKERPAMLRNHADALFSAERWHEAGRAFERVVEVETDAAKREDALYDGLAAHAKAEQQPDRLGAWALTDARRAVRMLGARYVEAFPKSKRVADVKFQVARAAYAEGEWKAAAELFATFCSEHPEAKDAAAAADLALDALHVAGDYEGLERTGRALAANRRLPESVRKSVLAVVEAATKERLGAVALTSSARTGDAAVGLVELAEQKKGSELGEQALHAAFVSYRDKRDYAKATEIGDRFVGTYPKSARSADVLSSLARMSMELANHDAAAKAYAQLFERFGNEVTGQEAARTAATLYLLLGEARTAALLLEKLPAEKRQGAVGRMLAEARLAANDFPGAEAAATTVLASNAADAEAGTLLVRALLARNEATRAHDAAQSALRAARRARVDDGALVRLLDAASEAALAHMRALPSDPLDPKVEALKAIQESSTQLASLAGGDLAVGGLFRIGAGYDHLAQTLNGLSAPPKLSKEDREKFLGAVAQQVAAMRKQSEEAFALCGRKGRELSVVSPVVDACLKKDPTLANVSVPSGGGTGGDAQKARAELVTQGPSRERIEVLASALLAGGDARRARLVYQRAIELQESSASAHAGLGAALVRLGEWAASRDSYRRALELDPTHDRAHAGLAGLYCRFGDREKGSAELSRVRNLAAVSDVDPAVATCGGAK